MEKIECHNREIPGERKYKLFKTSLCIHYANILSGAWKDM